MAQAEVCLKVSYTIKFIAADPGRSHAHRSAVASAVPAVDVTQPEQRRRAPLPAP